MKKFIIVLYTLFCGVAHAGPIANIEYIHALIKQRHGIDIEYNPALTSPKLAANMKYLLTAIDVANSKLNQIELSCYGDSAYATQNAADTDTAITAVDTLIQRAEFPFHFTPAVTSNTFSFTITAAGKYVVDWGDGTGECINKPTVGNQTISHRYATPAKNYTIGLGGKASAYSTTVGVIKFSALSTIDGCLGCVFSTIGDGVTATDQPMFWNAFREQRTLTSSIPPNLFDGVYGQPVKYMFALTFYSSGITGDIPGNLFAGIKGVPVSNVFRSTFNTAVNLTGVIPENLFAGIDDAAPSAVNMFLATFRLCSNLTGPSARINGRYLYEIWPDFEVNYEALKTAATYHDARGFSDYATMPTFWKVWQ